MAEEPKQSKTEIIVNEFSKKIEKFEEKYKMVPEMTKNRSYSYSRPMNRRSIFEQTEEE